MPVELLTPDQMAVVDRMAIERGPFSGIELMRRAGGAVAALVLARYPGISDVHVLCGPGNNGGDGYVAAEALRQAGVNVVVYGSGPPREGSDAALAAAESGSWPQPLAAFQPVRGALVIDALYGAGLARPVDDNLRRLMEEVKNAGLAVVAVDLPSGVSCASGEILGAAFEAELTVTFVRKKPGHLLLPGKLNCGDVVVADIGIPDHVVTAVSARCMENGPLLWRSLLPAPGISAHKYSRGHVAVISGGPAATGAARLSAMAAARAGAGAVTLLSPAAAMAENAAQLTLIMLREADDVDAVAAFLGERRPAAMVFGPGLSPAPETGQKLLSLLDRVTAPLPTVVDASALTSLAREPGLLSPPFGGRASPLVLTPHEGEFARLFADLSSDAMPSKLERARTAARRTEAVVVYKGPDTVIAAPDGRAAINANGTPLLATAGSGDVLSGLIAGLLAQGMAPFEAACAAVWMHAEAATRFGPGLIAEDLPLSILPVIKDLLDQNGSRERR